MVKEDMVEEDKEVPGDLRTARVKCDAANSIDKMIKLVLECPSLHDAALMPILDLEVRVYQQGLPHPTTPKCDTEFGNAPPKTNPNEQMAQRKVIDNLSIMKFILITVSYLFGNFHVFHKIYLFY